MTEIALKAGQVWRPKEGLARRITCVSTHSRATWAMVDWEDDKPQVVGEADFLFRTWIRRTKAELVEGGQCPPAPPP